MHTAAGVFEEFHRRKANRRPEQIDETGHEQTYSPPFAHG